MPSQATVTQQGVRSSVHSIVDELRVRRIQLPRFHIAPRVTGRESFSSPSQKHNPLYYLGFSSYMVIILIEIGFQQGATAYEVVGDRGGRTVEGESSRDRVISHMLGKARSFEPGAETRRGQAGTGFRHLLTCQLR